MSKINYKKTNEENEVSEYKSFDINDIKDDTIVSLFNDKETLLKYLKALENSVNGYQQQLNSLQARVDNQTQDIVNINGSISSLSGNITSINTNINNINTNIGNINDDIDNINDDIDNINDDISNINSDITNLDTKSDNLIPMQLWSNDANFNPNNLNPYNRYEWTKLEEGRFIKATTNDNNISNLETETLPNIKGKISNMYLKGDRNIVEKEGALKKSTTTNNNYGKTSSGSATNLTSIEFDASDSNKVYKNNAKVQPNCINLVCWLRGNLRRN